MICVRHHSDKVASFTGKPCSHSYAGHTPQTFAVSHIIMSCLGCYFRNVTLLALSSILFAFIISVFWPVPEVVEPMFYIGSRFTSNLCIEQFNFLLLRKISVFVSFVWWLKAILHAFSYIILSGVVFKGSFHLSCSNLFSRFCSEAYCGCYLLRVK